MTSRQACKFTKPSLDWKIWLQFYVVNYTARFVLRSKFLWHSYNIIKKIGDRAFGHLSIIERINDEIKNLSQMRDRSKINKSDIPCEEKTAALSYNSTFGYATEEKELSVAVKYKKDLQHKNSRNNFINQIVINSTSDFCDRENVKNVINFGCSYGYSDFEIARKNENIFVHAIDRSQSVKCLNDTDFCRENIRFYADDILEFLHRNPKIEKFVFIHTRIMIFLPKNVVETIYHTLSGMNCVGIIGTENWGISRETNQFHVLSPADTPSIEYRKGIILHNYEGILKKTGFDVAATHFYPMKRHLNPDMHLLQFIAESGR